MNTTTEMIEIIKAYDAGMPIQYMDVNGKAEEDWKDRDTYSFNFSRYTYRIKPNSKFKVGDKVILKEAEGVANSLILKITQMNNEIAMLDDCWERSIQELHADYINIEDALWYFETYDYSTKKWKLITSSRFTIKEADDLFGSSHNTSKWRPMYSLGFALNENK
nr:MAG TPA: hypothetical protein [Caudoviricetes sp.]